MSAAHPSHPQILNRLRRADGHLHNVVSMLEQGKPCLDVAQQLQAVEKAIGAAKRALIHDHLDHCLGAVTSKLPRAHLAQISEFKAITKYL